MPTDTDAPATARRRHAAGEDPLKRDQILEGARGVFMEMGFDAASMSDITRAAGVSKGTLYVYFASKEDLFVALVEETRDRLFAEVDAFLEEQRPLEERLRIYARRLAEVVCSDEVLRAQRIIIAMSERMPELGARFFDGVVARLVGRLGRLFEREAAAGRLRIAEPELAAAQFVELASAGLWRRRLFGKLPAAPAPATVAAVADSGVTVFLAAYGVAEG